MAGVRADAPTASEAAAASATKVFLSISVLLKTGGLLELPRALARGQFVPPGADIGRLAFGGSVVIAAAALGLRRSAGSSTVTCSHLGPENRAQPPLISRGVQCR